MRLNLGGRRRAPGCAPDHPPTRWGDAARCPACGRPFIVAQSFLAPGGLRWLVAGEPLREGHTKQPRRPDGRRGR